MVKYVLKKFGQQKRSKTFDLLGYTANELMGHILSHQNYKNVLSDDWSIDHVFPIQAFLDYNIFDVRLINCLENLRPITRSENSSKGDRYCKSEFEKWLISKGYEKFIKRNGGKNNE